VKQAWLQQQERGTVLGMRLIAGFSLLLGRRAGRLMLYPICLYFMSFMPKGRRASREYLSRVLGRPSTWCDSFRHFYYFASTLLDRAFFLSGRNHLFEINKYGIDVVRDTIDQGRGCLFLGAHLGSFDLMRLSGARKWGLKINMMMYEANAQKIKRVVESIGSNLHVKILPIGSMDSLLQAKERLSRGETLAILGDRVTSNENTVAVDFLGKKACFPIGPIQAAAVLNVPVVMFFGLYRGGNKYEVHFELFSDRVILSRKHRQQDLQDAVQRFATSLEGYCRRAPYNWFNFFDFWQLPGKQ